MRVVKSAEIRKQELLDCAVQLFGTQGYEATTINQIIAALNISKGAFYHHYSSKEDLVEALAERHARQVADRTRHVLEDESLDAFERLSVFLSMMRMSKSEAHAGMQAAFAPIFQPGNSHLYERSQAAIASVIRPILRDLIAEGIADRTFDSADPDEAADTILHLMGSIRPLITELFGASPLEAEALIERLVRRLRFLGTVVDRILGIPEGSLEFVDHEAVLSMAAVCRPGLRGVEPSAPDLPPVRLSATRDAR